MKRPIVLAAVLAAIGSFVSADRLPGRQLCEGFLPPNNLKIPVGDVHARGIEEDAFNKVLDRVEAVYAPIVAAKGATLVVNRRWEDPTVNAYAQQWGDSYYITMFGGLARHTAVTAEGFALVACHELGHHLGGFPRYDGDHWATSEGGSDYYATLKCLRRVFNGWSLKELDPVAGKACAEAFPAGSDRSACEKNAMAGHSIADLFAALRPGTPRPRFDTPDPSEVEETYTAHPAAQCRLDTYFQGSLCARPVGEDVAADDPLPGACNASAGDAVGSRPRCWYKPPSPRPQEGGEGVPPVAKLTLPEEKALQAKVEGLKAALSGRGL